MVVTVRSEGTVPIGAGEIATPASRYAQSTGTSARSVHCDPSHWMATRRPRPTCMDGIQTVSNPLAPAVCSIIPPPSTPTDTPDVLTAGVADRGAPSPWADAGAAFT